MGGMPFIYCHMVETPWEKAIWLYGASEQKVGWTGWVMVDLRQKVVLASLLVTKRHTSIAVVWIDMFGNPGSILASVMNIHI